MPSTWGTLTPAMAALAPLAGSTVYSWPVPEWATIRVLPLARGLDAVEVELPAEVGRRAAERQRADGPRAPAPLTGTK